MQIEIEGVDPVEIYGAGNCNIELMKRKFPKATLHARGNVIAIGGEPEESALLYSRIQELIEMKRRGFASEREEEFLERFFDKNEYHTTVEEVMQENSDSDIILWGNRGKAIKAKTRNQKRLLKEYPHNDLIFAIGPAGTGKTYTAIALAVRALKNREVRRLILTRPAVEAGERLGFLPGDLKEKLDRYLQPLYDALGDMIDSKKLQSYLEEGVIQIVPLAYMRGRTLDNAFVILDEAQNTTLGQLKMFLTRMGSNAKFIVTGDATQIDLPNKKESGLIKGTELLKDIKGISIINFGKEDIVRHPLVSKIIKAFEADADILPGTSGSSATEMSSSESAGESSSSKA